MYKGYIEISHDDELYSQLYNDTSLNVYDCLVNQYILVKDDDRIVDRLKWNGRNYERLSYKQIDNNYTGRIKPVNPQQDLAFDMLQDKETTIKVLTGRFGSGKTFLMIATALQLISEVDLIN
jgi:predicted ribonuclease YlaK